MEDVPVIDLASNDREMILSTLDTALRQYGFFYVTNHGIDNKLIQQQFDVAVDLFGLPLSEKRSMPFDSELDIGYVGCGVQTLNPDGTIQHTGDTKEQFMMTNNKLITTPLTNCIIDPVNVFDGSKNYKPNVKDHTIVTKEYASAAYKLNLKLNDLLFDALDLDETMKTKLGEKPFIVLKQMKYNNNDISDPNIGKFGAGAHTDWGSFTILATDQTPGLQIQMNNNEWLPVPPKHNCLIINSGDQIAQLTNGIYRSALHRVIIMNNNDDNNTTTESSSAARFSTAVFTYFCMDAIVEPLQRFVSNERPARYPYGCTTNEYFHYKLKESMGNGGY